MGKNTDLTKIANKVIDDIWDDSRRMFIPVYLTDIKTESQANAAQDLPLCYIWNELVESGALRSFSFSVNGSIVGSFLEKRFPRSHPEFAHLRDSIIESVRNSQLKVIQDTCSKAGRRPSELYPSDPKKAISAAQEKAISDQISLTVKTVAESIAKAAEGLAQEIELGIVNMDAKTALRAMASVAREIPPFPEEGLKDLEKVVQRSAMTAARKMVDLLASRAEGVAAQIEQGVVQDADAPSVLRLLAGTSREFGTMAP